MGFGGVSYVFSVKLPEFHVGAVTARVIKIACAVGVVSIAMRYLRQAADWTVEQRRTTWKLLAVLGVTALAAAAFLRWFA